MSVASQCGVRRLTAFLDRPIFRGSRAPLARRIASSGALMWAFDGRVPDGRVDEVFDAVLWRERALRARHDVRGVKRATFFEGVRYCIAVFGRNRAIQHQTRFLPRRLGPSYQQLTVE